MENILNDYAVEDLLKIKEDYIKLEILKLNGTILNKKKKRLIKMLKFALSEYGKVRKNKFYITAA